MRFESSAMTRGPDHAISHAGNGDLGEAEACLTGETFAGPPIEGCYGIRIVPPVVLVDSQEAAPTALVVRWLIPASGFQG